MPEGIALLSAGGTGGHLFPAEALAHELLARGWQIHLATDERAKRFTDGFPASQIHVIRSATFASRNPLAIAKSLGKLIGGYRQARKLIARHAPVVAVGFGGYPTIPPMLAAIRTGVPVVLAEQNAVLGRANRFLARFAKVIAAGLPMADKTNALSDKIIVTGNPVRPEVLAVAGQAYQPAAEFGQFKLLIFGGSQGARFFSEIMPKVLDAMPLRARQRLRIVQQARPEDLALLNTAYADHDMPVEVSPFFDDMPEKIADANLVLCRAGASSVSELAVIGRPSILVPLPGALDNDQTANATLLADSGGALVAPQPTLSGEKLSRIIVELMDDSERVAEMAASAKKVGVPDAAAKLADVVEHVAKKRSIEQFEGRKQS